MMNAYHVLIRTYTVEKVKIRAESPAGASERAEQREYEEEDVLKVQDGGVDYTEILGYWDEQGVYHDQHEDEMSDEEYGVEGEED